MRGEPGHFFRRVYAMLTPDIPEPIIIMSDVAGSSCLAVCWNGGFATVRGLG
jgi:hypothetical protein